MLADYLHARDVLIAPRDRVEADLAKLAGSAPRAHTVGRLRCLRGIDTLSAFGLCAATSQHPTANMANPPLDITRPFMDDNSTHHMGDIAIVPMR
jgi:hypothetical protein